MNDKERRGPRRHAATIKQVAERAGVSQMTVSRVLNHSEAVREKTRAKVEVAIKELNYRPNFLAQGLARGRALFLGLVYDNPSRSYISEVLVGALNQCRTMGHHLVLESVEDGFQSGSEQEVVERIAAAGLDGVIVIPPLSEDDALLDALHRENIPSVIVAPGQGRAVFPSVAIDDEVAAEAMMTALFEHGHTDIAFIRGDERQSAARRRYRGYIKALEAKGIATKDAWISQGDFSYRSGMAAAMQLISARPRPTVIFACNDDMAAGAVAAIQAAGVKVPGQVSVVGFDDSSIASGIWPALTTVRQPIAEMASQAVLLLSHHDSDDADIVETRHVTLGIDLIYRASLARLN